MASEEVDAQGSLAAASAAAQAFGLGRYVYPSQLLTQFNPQRILAAAGPASPGIGADPAMQGPMYVFFTCPDLNLGLTVTDQQQDAYAGNTAYPFLGSAAVAAGAAAGISFGPVETAVLGLGSPVAPAALAALLTGGQGFVKLLTNMCKGFSPSDVVMDYVGVGDAWDGARLQFPKGSLASRQDGTLQLDFEEWAGTPVLLLIKIWFDYIEAVSKGYLAPKASMSYIDGRVIDYACSIYAFQTLADACTIEWGARWTGCTPAAVPHSAWAGSAAPSYQPVSLTVPWNYAFYEPMDPTIFAEFNLASQAVQGLGGPGASIVGGNLGGANPLGIANPQRSAYYLVFDETAATMSIPGGF